LERPVVEGERQIFGAYIKAEGLKATAQRTYILDAFLSTDKHVSVEDVYVLVNRGRRRVGLATVWRTMKLIADCGLAHEVAFDDGVSRFEHTHGKSHHHHLICTRCKSVIEFSSEEMDAVERAIAEDYDFELESHRFEIFGLCRKCRRKRAKK
jgi:Fur family ferric uptake transcriptional regulator